MIPVVQCEHLLQSASRSQLINYLFSARFVRNLSRMCCSVVSCVKLCWVKTLCVLNYSILGRTQAMTYFTLVCFKVYFMSYFLVFSLLSFSVESMVISVHFDPRPPLMRHQRPKRALND